jgi:hypothetical protein
VLFSVIDHRGIARVSDALSPSGKPGRPRISAQLRALIKRMWSANPTWGSPRIKKLGIDVAKSTVERYQPKEERPIYGGEVRRKFQAMGIEEVVTAPASPW